jgi:hypothetical protein
MSEQQRQLVSSRRCPVCEGMMHYHRTWMTWLTHRYLRRCTHCGHTDAATVKLSVTRPTT